MNNSGTTVCATFFLMLASMAFSISARAQDVDPEWPCIQRLIPAISPAIMWPVPVEEDTLVAYRKHREIRALAEVLGDVEVFTDEHRQLISEFAESIPAAERESELTLLATGIVDVSNRIRKDYIKGIKRYTRQQIDISEQIEDTLNELSLLDGKAESDNSASRQEIEETLRWHERVYDQRERTIQLLCEQPVELEQRLSEVLRDTAQHLP